MPSGNCYPDKAPLVDDLLETLCDNLRREVVYYFEAHSETETATLDALVAHLEDRVPSADAERLEVQLHHYHLPKLAEDGWLEYDSRLGDVRYRGHEQAKHLLGEIHDVF
jgi:hypothetical protein